jgi:hypothetical protein
MSAQLALLLAIGFIAAAYIHENKRRGKTFCSVDRQPVDDSLSDSFPLIERSGERRQQSDQGYALGKLRHIDSLANSLFKSP